MILNCLPIDIQLYNNKHIVKFKHKSLLEYNLAYLISEELYNIKDEKEIKIKDLIISRKFISNEIPILKFLR